MKIGWMVPQFPEQTHILFWREFKELEKLGLDVKPISTRPPNRTISPHSWSQSAIERTFYLMPIGIGGMGQVAMRLVSGRWGDLVADFFREGPRFAAEALVMTPYAARLADYVERSGIRHLHVHSAARAALVAAIAHRLFGLSYSLTLHGPLGDYGPYQNFKWKYARYGIVLTDELLAQLRADVGANLPKDIAIAAMGVDVEHFSRPTPYVPWAAGETLKLFACGRLNPTKGHAELIQAVKILVDKGMNVSLEIAGEDEVGGAGYHRVLSKLISDLDLEGTVTLLGAMPEERVKAGLLNAHIAVFPSHREGVPVAIMESLSIGTPTIATDVGGVRKLISDGKNGVVVPPKIPEVFADAIEKLAGEPENAKLFSVESRKTIVEGFHAGISAGVIRKYLPSD